MGITSRCERLYGFLSDFSLSFCRYLLFGDAAQPSAVRNIGRLADSSSVGSLGLRMRSSWITKWQQIVHRLLRLCFSPAN